MFSSNAIEGEGIECNNRESLKLECRQEGYRNLGIAGKGLDGGGCCDNQIFEDSVSSYGLITSICLKSKVHWKRVDKCGKTNEEVTICFVIEGEIENLGWA